MLTLSRPQQILIGSVLVALMIATRGHHLTSIKQWLPSASWAVFFLAGVYLRPAWMLAVLLALAAAIDFAAVTWGGVSAFCVSPAYVALLPAYGALWFAGRWYARRITEKPLTLVTLAASTTIGTAVCEILSSGGFYFYSGRFTDPSLAEFAARFARYFPHDLQSVWFWVGIAALLQIMYVAWQRRLGNRLAK